MKGILVIDIPTNCNECAVKCDGYTAKQYAEKGITRPSWCPLRPLPNKLDANDWHRMFGGTYKEREAKGYGYNACLDEILGETE